MRLTLLKEIADIAMAFKNDVFHVLGLSCLGSAVFLMVYIFYHVALYGGIICIEQNLFIVTCEVGMTALAVIYFSYVFSKTLIRHLAITRSNSRFCTRNLTLNNKKRRSPTSYNARERKE